MTQTTLTINYFSQVPMITHWAVMNTHTNSYIPMTTHVHT